MKKILLSTIVSLILLFIWSGITQLLPWGVPTAQKVSVQTSSALDIPDLIRLPAHTLTTDEFESRFMHKVSTYQTDRTFSWIVMQPLQNNYTRYFMYEAMTQLMVALLLSMILYLTAKLNNRIRLLIIGLMGTLAAAATYGQLMNWWGLPASYALGVGVNLILGWLAAGFVIVKLIIKQT